MSNKVISSVGIIGCGWLGGALALQLKNEGVAVLATRSNTSNVEQLKCKDINAKVLALPMNQNTLNDHSIFNQQCLVIAITPQFRLGRIDYAEKVKQLVVAASLKGNVEKIILLSSTAVYNGLLGSVDENIALDLSADKVSVLNAAEQAVLDFNLLNNNISSHDKLNDDKLNKDSLKANTLKDKQDKKKGYVLRLSGLIGPNRHPGKFLLSGRMLKSPEAIVNLIHQKDAVGLILTLLKSDIDSGIFNGVSATQISKKHFYQAAAKAVGLPMPIFEKSKLLSETSNSVKHTSKVVSGNKVKDKLNYSFVHDDLLYWLSQSD